MFFLIVLLVYFGMHYFVYWRIVKGLELSKDTRNIILIGFVIVGCSFFLAHFLGKSIVAIPLGYVGYIWMGIISIALSVFILQMIAAWILPSQVKFITQIAIIIVLVGSGFSLVNAAWQPRVKEIKIPISKLPMELSGFSIVELADLHLERIKSAKWLESIVEKTDSLHPDVIAIVGDLTDEDIRKNHGFVNALKQLSAKYGIFAVTGNHEYYRGLQAFFALCDSLDITVLKNSHVTVANSVEIVGVNDETGKGYPGGGPDLDEAMSGCDVTKPVILLSHQPLNFKEAVEKGVDLQLSGHVHAGQIPPMDLIVMFYYKYPYGLYHIGSSFIYTTSGTDIWGPPMRLFSRSEIVKFILVPAKS
jgi:predicted MPP superfamily phosphohydrolase